jgi:predicted ATPase/serine/threonine protein kinase
MDEERMRLIDLVLEGAVELDGTERRAFLDGVCVGDAELRAEVEALLSLEAEAEQFIEQPAIEAAGDALGAGGAAWAIGNTVGPYRIEARLGAGGMGEVYRALDERLVRSVAIKVLLEGADAELVRRFGLEAQAASSLNHPNIVTVHDVGEVDGAPYLVTEYVEGETLRERLRSGMAVGDAVAIARQVASALEAAHGAGVVHRDVKPENVMVRPDGLVKVVDFGIAKLLERGRSEGEREGGAAEAVTGPGVVIGTAAYMSPEQARGDVVDGRTDVWSLGVMLCEMVAGRRPFRGPTQIDLLVAIVSKEPEGMEELPEGLGEIVGRSLRKRLEDRYQTAGEMAAALERFRGALGERRAGDRVPTDVDANDAATVHPEAETNERTIPPTNLPEEVGSLIGRERELGALVGELRRARLVTVTGPGGTGKTRLATAAGRALLPEFEQGAFFVELAAIREPALVVSAIAQALEVKETGGTGIGEKLERFLRDRELLLVLDNFEQVVDAAPLVARLLAGAPRLKALVTSRERLHVSVEREFPLAPLELPPSDRLPTSGELGGFGAVALLVERARAARPGFELSALSDPARGAVAEICRRLDGLPLAIELAAARLRMLTPEALLARLDRQLKLLTGGARDLPERQQTMRAAIAWSYDLLDDAERDLFARLSVFSGGWTLDAAEEVTRGPWPVARDADSEIASGGNGESRATGHGSRATTDILDLLTQLADKSLVVVEEGMEERRYRMLETIRQFAAERVAERGEGGEEERLRAAHASWFVELAEAHADEYRQRRNIRLLVQLERDLDNMRAALEWSERRAPGMLLRLCGAMGLVWSMRGLWSEGRSWLERALVGDRSRSLDRAKALFWAGRMARSQSDYEPAREWLTESIALRRELGDRFGVANALGELGSAIHGLGDFDAAEALWCEGLALADELGDLGLRAHLLNYLAAAVHERHDVDRAQTLIEEYLSISRELGDGPRVAVALYNLGVMAHGRGEYGRATELLEESLALARDFDQRPLATRVSHVLGNVAGSQGDFGRAARLRAEASREYLAMGDRYMIAILFEDVVPEALARGMGERAAHLLGALMRFEETGEIPPAEWASDLLGSVRNALGEREADEAMAEGRKLTLEQALDLALSD